jgi:hypothetical protein
MTTLTVSDAASRLGVKPAKVREFISDRKLSARPSPPTAVGRDRDRLLLDADEVDALASVRAHKRRQREGTSAGTARLPDGAAEEALIGEIQSAATPELAAPAPASERQDSSDLFRRPGRNGYLGRDTIPVWRRALAHIISGPAHTT